MNKVIFFTKKIIPTWATPYAVSFYSKVLNMGIFTYDRLRFLKHYSKYNLDNNTESQLTSRIIFHSHAIEKGLSHREIRLGFGKTALQKLSNCMKVYKKKGYNTSIKSYQNALSVIKEYLILHNDLKYNTSYLSDLFDQDTLNAIHETRSNYLGGYRYTKKDDKLKNSSKNFKELFEDRWSVREYESSPVDIDKLKLAISIATKTPSVCNRQPYRATVIQDPELIRASLAIQGGLNGYSIPPILIAVTVDLSSFVSTNERNQAFIDGGLFSMALLLSLEYVELAACPLNAMFNVKRDKQMRKVINTPESESYIMFMSIGNFKEETKTPKSFRYDQSHITKYI